MRKQYSPGAHTRRASTLANIHTSLNSNSESNEPFTRLTFAIAVAVTEEIAAVATRNLRASGKVTQCEHAGRVSTRRHKLHTHNISMLQQHIYAIRSYLRRASPVYRNYSEYMCAIAAYLHNYPCRHSLRRGYCIQTRLSVSVCLFVHAVNRKTA